MKMAHLSKTPPNMSSIGSVCDSLGKTSLTSLVGNYWATGGLRVNSSPVKGKFIIFPLFLLEENAILPMTARADCALLHLYATYTSQSSKGCHGTIYKPPIEVTIARSFWRSLHAAYWSDRGQGRYGAITYRSDCGKGCHGTI